MKKNNPKKWAFSCLACALVGLALLIVGIINDRYEAMWMIMVGIMLFATFIICFGIFFRQSKKLDRLFAGNGLLAHWVYTDGDEIAEKEKKIRFKNNAMLMVIVSICFVVFTLLFVLFGFDDIDDAGFFVCMMAAILILLWIVAMVAPVFAARKMKASSKEAFISREGAWVMGEYYFWKAPLMQLKNIAFFPGEKSISYIEIVIETMQRSGWQANTVRIAVPRGDEEAAINAVNEIRRMNCLS